MSRIIYLIVLLGGIAQAQDATVELNTFAAQWGVQDWPRLEGCGYQRSFQEQVVGLILDVRSERVAVARWDGRCHVPVRHTLTAWPQDLEPGRYVVAVTLAPERRAAGAHSHMDRRNIPLQILGVMGDTPNQEPYINVALQRICASPAVSAETDRDCAERNQSRNQH